MALVKRFTLAALILILAAPLALAGPNEGGVLVVHDPGIAYTSDANYQGMSGVGCGQDGPSSEPYTPVCPPYDPIGGPDPCDPNAANPTSHMAPDVKHVWYVLAAFPTGSCPRLKTVGFRIRYDDTKVYVDPTLNGAADAHVFSLPKPSDQTGADFPADGSGLGMSFLPATVSGPPIRTSLLQELWWFAGYAVSGAEGAKVDVAAIDGSDRNFGDDLIPVSLDPIAGFGTLGLGGTTGHNPTPVPPGPTGSCCVPAGTCTVTTESNCTAGTWTLSGTCVPNNCPAPEEPRACCTPQRECTLVLEANCVLPSQWHPEWSACAPNECLTLEGACCAPDGSCTLTTMSNCGPSMTWHGELTSCAPGSCPTLPIERTSWGQIKATYRTN
jgi:hypothetical protein